MSDPAGENKKSRLLGRRDFVRNTGGAAGVVALGGCTPGDPYAVSARSTSSVRGWRHMEERWISTSCAQCPAGCVVKVRVVQGDAVRITGEPRCPINRGGIGPRGIAGVQALYDPDRIKTPLKRTGSRGEPNFESISWDDAIAQVAHRLGDLRSRGEAERLLIMCGRDRGMMLELWQRFGTAFGTPNVVTEPSADVGAGAAATWLTQGVREMTAYDWQNSNYLLALGTGVLDGSCQRVYLSRAAAHLRRGRAGRRARIVQVDPALSTTSVSADEWVPIRPGTYGAFALGLCHVLVQEGLYDAEFVAGNCSGFEDVVQSADTTPLVTAPGFKSALEHYAPDAVARICDVPAVTIIKIAHELAERRPSLAILDPYVTLASNGVHTALAVQALNALLGGIERPGGALVQREPPLSSWPDVDLDEVARRARGKPPLGLDEGRFPLATSAAEALPERLSRDASVVDTALLYYANPCYAGMAPSRWREALAKVPFLISFTPFMDETAGALADLILPDHTYLERWEDGLPAPTVGFPVLGLRQPVVEPVHDTRATGDVVIQLADAIGGAVADAFPWQTFQKALFERLEGLHRAQRGSIVEAETSAFFERLREDGFWAEPSWESQRWEDAVRTESGRVELYLTKLRSLVRTAAKAAGAAHADFVASLGLPEDLDALWPTSHIEATYGGDGRAFPLMLVPHRPGTYAEGSGANLPWLAELGPTRWSTVVELNPETARAHRVNDGDWVEVSSAAGSVRAKACVHEGIRPDCARMACGGGHSGFGRFAQGRGANVMELLVPRLEPLTGLPAVMGTRVKVRKA